MIRKFNSPDKEFKKSFNNEKLLILKHSSSSFTNEYQQIKKEIRLQGVCAKLFFRIIKNLILR